MIRSETKPEKQIKTSDERLGRGSVLRTIIKEERQRGEVLGMRVQGSRKHAN